MRKILCLVAVLALAGPGCRPRSVTSGQAAAAPRTELPSYDVVHVPADRVVVDGVLAPDEWDAIVWTEAFVAPGDGNARPGSPVAARAKLAWNERGLLVAMEVGDGDARSPHARDAVDPHIWADASGIELMLQPGNRGDNRNYYEVQVDVVGAVWDTRFDDYNRPITGEGNDRRFGHQGWTAELERGVMVEPGQGYAVEFLLPWSTLAAGDGIAIPPADGDIWRANLYSFRDGQRYALAWSAILGGGNFHFAPRFGHLRFVRAQP